MGQRVCWIGSHAAPGRGYPSVADRLADALRDQGHQLVLASRRTGRLAKWLDMRRTLIRRRDDYDIVTVDVYSTAALRYALWSARLARRLGKRVVLVLHGGGLPRLAASRPRRLRALFALADRIVVPSPYLRRTVCEPLGFSCAEIPNPVPLDAFPAREMEIARPRLLWVRSFRDHYRPEVAVQVLAALAADHPDAHLTMVGPGHDGSLARTQRLASELGVSERVHFTGLVEREAVARLGRESDVFLNTTSVDNMPVSVMEALALGMCIVSADVGGIGDLLVDGQNALLVPDADASAMTAAVQRVLSDPKLARRLSLGAKAGAARFGIPDVARAWRRLWDEVAASANPLAWDVPPLPPRPVDERTDLSIVIPLRDEAARLEPFLDRIARLEAPTPSVELLLVEGQSRDATRALLDNALPALRDAHPTWRVERLDSPSGLIPHGLNAGILQSRGDVVVRLDAHTLFPEDYLPRLMQALERTGAHNVGGVVRARPGAETPTARAIARARGDLFGAGRSPFRTGARSGPQKTVPFGCFPRETLERCGLYDNRLTRNQDIELNHRVRAARGVVHQEGTVVAEHLAPAGISALFRKHYANGRWNVFATIVAPGCLSWLHFVPGVMLLLIAAAFWVSPWAALVPAGVAAAADLARAFRIDARGHPLRLALAFAAIQVGHGLGQLMGLVSAPVFWPLHARRYPRRAR